MNSQRYLNRQAEPLIVYNRLIPVSQVLVNLGTLSSCDISITSSTRKHRTKNNIINIKICRKLLKILVYNPRYGKAAMECQSKGLQILMRGRLGRDIL